ncbi:hypothetical protein MSG28_014800 [Choristoneura fumiferana]|uniref:Uncharacterized protein n=1 Tax=Choristoneura fumiferana TaxID=7141 RepID=A0ACC0JSQ3_CHOFU|nr:hypothetical protein MSG28_014800 [Choristoneura fumiferana]
MAHQLSRREAEELRPSLDRAIYRTIGKSDSSLLSTVSYCLTSGPARIATTILLANPAVKQQCLAWRVRQPLKLLALEVSHLRPLGRQCICNTTGVAGDPSARLTAVTASKTRSRREALARSLVLELHTPRPDALALFHSQAGAAPSGQGLKQSFPKYERRKIIDKISSHIDSKKASKLADKILALAQELVSSSKSTKRKHESEEKRDSKRSKHEEKEEKKPEEKEKNGNGVEPVEITPLALPVGETIGSKITGLSADRIKVMMANAQKEIEERKRALTAMKGGAGAAGRGRGRGGGGGGRAGVSGAAAAAQQIKAALPARALAPPSVIKPVLYSKPAVSAGVTAEELEKQRKIAELQARIQKKLAGGAIPAGPTGPAPLILDREGRTVDTSGRRVQLTHVAPTLKRSPPGATGPAPLILDREGRTVDTSGRRVQLTHVAPTLKGTAPLACSGARRGPTGPAPLILDREGRTVDTSGRRVQLTHVAPTLKRSPPGATGPAPLILDREGRTVDTSGRRVQLTHVAPTLKRSPPGATGPAPLILDREGRTVDTSGRRVQLTHVAPTLKRSPPGGHGPGAAHPGPRGPHRGHQRAPRAADPRGAHAQGTAPLACSGARRGATGPAPLILDREGRTVDTSGRRVQLTHVAPTLKRSPPGATGPAPLILDREGRTVDTSGRRVQLTHVAPTLKLTHVAPTLKVPPLVCSGARRGATGPAPLILDREGRTVDTSGRRVQLTHVAPTLKANIRAKRREEFRAQLSGAATSEPAADASWVDPRVALKAPARARRALRFHEPGKFRQQAERLRMKAQLEKLQNEISQIARKTGISSATKLALLASDKAEGDRVPDIEWVYDSWRGCGLRSRAQVQSYARDAQSALLILLIVQQTSTRSAQASASVDPRSLSWFVPKSQR